MEFCEHCGGVWVELETWLRFMYRLVKVDRTSSFCMQASTCSMDIYKAYLIWP